MRAERALKRDRRRCVDKSPKLIVDVCIIDNWMLAVCAWSFLAGERTDKKALGRSWPSTALYRKEHRMES
jgi:hypothetical protein